MKNKVKYTRKEYRDEYLKSDEWIKLRDLIMESKPVCQCCGNKASDVHHLVYRNIVDIKVTDLLPVCRRCHEYIHEAITDGWITQNVQDIQLITEKTISILQDEEYKTFRQWLNGKHFLSEEEQETIKKLQPVVIKKISGLVKKNVWYDKLNELKFTGRQILKIRNIIILSIKRKKDGLDKPDKNGKMVSSKPFKKLIKFNT